MQQPAGMLKFSRMGPLTHARPVMASVEKFFKFLSVQRSGARLIRLSPPTPRDGRQKRDVDKIYTLRSPVTH